jgi:glutamine cyclotransferase/GNAT superfamily N-acetyltransferase
MGPLRTSSDTVWTIRRARLEDVPFLRQMLYEAAYWRPGVERPPLEAGMAHPELAKILDGWGQRPGDTAFVALSGEGERIGAAWYRFWSEADHSYGFVDENTPEIGIGVVAQWRRHGVGRALLAELIERAGQEGIGQLSLSVEPDNQARRLYESSGFEEVGRSAGGSLTMQIETCGKRSTVGPAAAMLSIIALLLLLGQIALRGGEAVAGELAGCALWASPACPQLPAPCRYTYSVVRSYPHDTSAFTQGLVLDGGKMYEGTGIRWQSSLREVDLETGDVLRSYALPSNYFGEGIAVYDEWIVQLTWQSNVGFVYDRDSLELLQTFGYPTEGWGITYDGERLIVSDGTATLHFWDPVTFEEIGRVDVRDGGDPVSQLNELEYVCGEVLANVWYSDSIARIDPGTGEVIGWIDLAGLLGPEERPGSGGVLNGIAFDGESGRLFVTGKLWPWLFEIELIPLTD